MSSTVYQVVGGYLVEIEMSICGLDCLDYRHGGLFLNS